MNSVIKENTTAHERMIDQLGRHEMRIMGHDMRLEDHTREHMSLRANMDALDHNTRMQGERIARMEAKLNVNAQ